MFSQLYCVCIVSVYSTHSPNFLQLENEYGSGGGKLCDFSYTSHLRDLIRSGLGPNVVLFTMDNPYPLNMRCGKIPDVYATVDFSSGK